MRRDHGQGEMELGPQFSGRTDMVANLAVAIGLTSLYELLDFIKPEDFKLLQTLAMAEICPKGLEALLKDSTSAVDAGKEG